MPATFNLTIIASCDREESARCSATYWNPSGHAIELLTRPYL